MNVVILNGNVTRDPEVRVVKSGSKETKVANFTLASNRHFTRADGSKDKEVTFVDCEVWDSGAETIGQFVKKGSPLLIEGSLKLDTWETDGEKRSKLKVRVNRFDLGPRNKTSESVESSVEGGAEEGSGVIPF